MTPSQQEAACRQARGGRTPAQHARALAMELIYAEEASSDQRLLQIAAFRRRCIGLPPRTQDRTDLPPILL